MPALSKFPLNVNNLQIPEIPALIEESLLLPLISQEKESKGDRRMENGASSEGKDPSAFLGEIIGAPVTVKLNSGVVYKGVFLLLCNASRKPEYPLT